MVRKKFLLSALCFLFIIMQSCVHGGLDDCPPMVNYAVAFEYTHHAWINDRFYDDVKKINLFVFDKKNNLVYTTAEGLSPYETNFKIPFELPMGNYHILAWGNVLADQPFTVSPTDFVKGVTKLSDAKLALQRQAGNLCQRDMDKLLFGEIDVEIPLYFSRVDTVPLINDTKKIRVVIHWDHTGQPGEIIDYDEVQVRLEASNAIYNFSNQLTGTNNVIYKPFDYSYKGDKAARDFESKVNYGNYDLIKEISNSCVYDFTSLRIVTNSPIMLVVERKKSTVSTPVTIANINIIQSFIGLFDEQKVLVSNRQSNFDKYDNYRMDLYFTYERIAGEYVTGGFRINDWHEVAGPYVPPAH